MPVRYVATLITIFMLSGIASAARAQEMPDSIPRGKRTVLGKYILSTGVYRKWKAGPERIKILDVRTLGEYVFVGHAPMAYNIPFRKLTDQWDPGKGRYQMPLNPGFVEAVNQSFGLEDTILVICRSGGRSAAAVNLLAEAGFRNAYSILDGFEGDMVKDPASYYNGKRMKNGWKNSGAPWTHDLDPKLVCQE